MDPGEMSALGASGPGDIAPEIQAALVQSLPDLLFLVGDAREQLELCRTRLASLSASTTEAEASKSALQKVVTSLQEERDAHSVAAEQLEGQLEAANVQLADAQLQLAQAGRDLVRFDEALTHQAEATRQAEERAREAEQQLVDLHGSTSWRLSYPLRAAALVATRLRGKPMTR